MALDFSRFGTPVQSQKSTLDFSQFGTPVQQEKSMPDFSASGTPVKKQQAISASASESETMGAIGVSPEFGGTTGTYQSEPEEKIKYDDIVKRDDLFNIANRAMKAYGQPGFDEKKETRDQFIERFYTQQRKSTTSTTFGTVPLLYQMKNADTQTARDLGAGFLLFERAENSPKQLKAIGDYLFYTFTDPMTYAGAGIGKATATMAARKGTEQLAKSVVAQRAQVETAKAAAKTPVEKVAAQIAQTAIEPQRQVAKKALERSAFRKGVAASTVAEGTVASAGDIMAQRAEREATRLVYDINEYVPEEIKVSEEEKKIREETDWERTLFIGTVSSALSGLGSALIPGAGARVNIRDRGELVASELERRGIKTQANMDAEMSDAEKKISAALTTQFDSTVSDLVKQRGRELLNEFDPATALTDSKIKNDVAKISTRVALNILKKDPLKFGYTGADDAKISDAIYNVLTNIERIDDIEFEQALTRSGVTLDEFAAMNLTTASDAGRSLQQLSVASRNLNKARQLDPNIDERLKKLYKAPNETAEATSRYRRIVEGALNTPRWLMNETKALVVSGIDTLSRNTIGNAIGLTFKASTDLLEGYIYAIGKAAKTISTDQPTLTVLRESMSDAHGKAVGTMVMLARSGLTKDITENILANNPVLLSRMSSVTQDLETQQLSALSRWAVSFNSGMDGLFRRASFVSSVESQLKGIGYDLYKDVLAGNKEIPASILRRAYDDAAKDTFSYTPKEFAKTFSKFEDFFEAEVGAPFVKLFDRPGFELAVTFPRFVTNAVAFQYKYSPFGLIGAAEYGAAARKALAAGNVEQAEMLKRDAMRKYIQATTGIALLVWATNYRLNNPDINWSEIKNLDNTTSDMKSIFPVAQFLGAGEIIAKMKTGIGNIDYKGIAESVLGFKTPAGTQNTILAGVIDFISSEEKRLDVFTGIGKVVGDYVGRASQPFILKQVFDYIDIVRGDEGVKARDPNIIEAETETGKFAEAATQRVQAKLPVFKEDLPAAVPRFADVASISKEGEFVNRIVGFRTTPNRSELEKEIIKYGVDIYGKYSRPSGDRDFDRMAIQETNKNALKLVGEKIRGEDYANATPTQRKKMIDRQIEMAVKEGRAETRKIFAEKYPDKLNRIDYLALSKDEKKIVNELYARDHNGRTMEEDKAYDKLKEYADFKNLKYASGGLVQQMNALFGK